MLNFYTLVTRYGPEQIAAVERGLADGTLHPMEAKKELAREIVSIFHGDEAAARAEAHFARVFQAGQLPAEMPVHVLDAPVNVVDLLVEAGLARSKSEARRLVQQGGVRLDGEQIEDIAHVVAAEGVLQVGKRKFVQAETSNVKRAAYCVFRIACAIVREHAIRNTQHGGDTMDGQTTLVGVMGWPIAHSLSPVMHNAAFEALGMNWRYVPVPVRPGQVGAAVAGLKALGFRGCNVTVPHKEAVIPHLDHMPPRVARFGAVNTLIFDRGARTGSVHAHRREHGRAGLCARPARGGL